MRYLSRPLAAFFIVSFLGCATPRDSVGYIKVKWHRTDTAWRDAAKLRNVSIHQVVGAVGAAWWDGEVCHIFSPDIKVEIVNGEKRYPKDKLDTLGHELKHCFDGSFH